jgi:hypothetical protein
MTTLADFLLARIADDQAAGERAAVWLTPNGLAWMGPTPQAATLLLAISGHRMLAECDAKRRIVEKLSEGLGKHWGPAANPEREWEWCPRARTEEYCRGTDLEWGPDAPCECAAEWPDYKQVPLLRLLALPYADHPDYRPEWKPT